MKQVLLTIIVLHCLVISFSQTFSNNKALETLSTSKQPILVFGKQTTSRYLSIDKLYKNHFQTIVKSDSGVFCLVNGTGMIFKQIKPQQFSRIDSTLFWGYNIGAFSFSYKSDIYNLGGSGLWRSNGHLRKYNFKAHEWDIVPLNQEIPLISGDNVGMIYYDQLDGKIYTSYTYLINDGIKAKFKNVESDFKVMSLNLESKEWNYLGHLNSSLINGIKNEYNLAITPIGLLTIGSSNLSLWDFKNNKLFQLNEANGLFQSIKRGIDTTLVFYKDSSLFLSRGETNLDSVKLTINDFHQIGTIYSSSLFTILHPYRKAILSLIIVLFSLLLYIGLSTYKKLVIRRYERARTENEASQGGIKIFKDQELLLLNLLVENSNKGIKTSIEEINSILGMDSRSIETQKAQRHKVITSINDAYIAKTDRKLIISDKLDFDRRSFVYFISEEELKTLSKYMPD